jgi:hypothetical protein
MRVDVGAEGYQVAVELEAYDGEECVAHRLWTETVPR